MKEARCIGTTGLFLLFLVFSVGASSVAPVIRLQEDTEQSVSVLPGIDTRLGHLRTHVILTVSSVIISLIQDMQDEWVPFLSRKTLPEF